MSNNDDKAPKNNGLCTNPYQRLASFRAPRDLSLGGVKPNKKIFTPNLNVTRNKNKGASTSSARDPKREDRHKKDFKQDRHKHMRSGPNVIKSSGVFSEGLGSVEKHSNRVSYGREVESLVTLRKPTIRVRDFVKIDKELEERQIKALLGDYADDVNDDFKHALDVDAPVKLPLDDGGWLLSRTKKLRLKQETIVKKELKEDGPVRPLPVLKSLAKSEIFEDTDVVNILRNDQSALLLLQLPDSLPGSGGTGDEEDPRYGNKPTDTPSDNPLSNPTDSEPNREKVLERCHLSSLEEGRIGKLLVHRSGRVTLALGSTMLEVSPGTKPCFHQEVVSVATDEDSLSSTLVSLGPLLHKLCIIPEWDRLFNDV